MEWLKRQFEYITGDESWILQVFVIVFVTLITDYVAKIIISSAQRKLQKTETLWDDALLHSIRGPASVLVWVVGLSLAGDILKLEFTTVIRELGVILAIAWAIVRFIKEFEQRLVHHSEKLGDRIDRTTADAIAQLLRISVVITALLVTLQTLGFNISAILAFGGIGGIAVGFAAKDLLANFFGGLMIYLDRPFAIGDWVRSPDRSIEGTVERIGWRLTVIRTFDKRPLYIPNSVFASITVENPSRMSHRRIYETIGIRYADISSMRDIIAAVKAMLRSHPDIAQDQTMIVNFNEFASSSVDFFVYTFTRTTDWIEYHEIKQDVLLKISDIISEHNAEIAFPTSTVHIADGLALNSSA